MYYNIELTNKSSSPNTALLQTTLFKPDNFTRYFAARKNCQENKKFTKIEQNNKMSNDPTTTTPTTPTTTQPTQPTPEQIYQSKVEKLQNDAQHQQLTASLAQTTVNSLKATIAGLGYGVYHGISHAPSQTPIFSGETWTRHMRRPIFRFSLLFGAMGLMFEGSRHLILYMHYPNYTSLASMIGGAASGALFGQYAFEIPRRSTSLLLKSSLLFALCATVLDLRVLRYGHEQYWRQERAMRSVFRVSDESDDLSENFEKRNENEMDDLTDEQAKVLLEMLLARQSKEKQQQQQQEETKQ